MRIAKPITIAQTGSEPEPDIALVQPQSYRQKHPIPSEVYLIIEFSNTSLEKDTEEKRRAYAAARIADYWVVNLRQGELIVYRQPIQEDYHSVQRLQNGQISPLMFPDIVVEVKALL